MTAELERHIGHRTTLLDTRRLRCVDCTQTVLLTLPSPTTSTSNTSVIPAPGDPTCNLHGRYAGTCKACAADAKADEHRQVIHQPTADVTARAAEVRAKLAAVVRQPAHTPGEEASP